MVLVSKPLDADANYRKNHHHALEMQEHAENWESIRDNFEFTCATVAVALVTVYYAYIMVDSIPIVG